MTELTTSLVLNIKNSQWANGLRKAGFDVDRFADKTERNMKKADRSISGFAKRTKKELSDLDRMTGSSFGNLRSEIIGIGTAWAGLQISKDSAFLDKQLIRMSQTAGVTRDKTKELRNELFLLQKDHGTHVNQMVGGYEKLIQMGLSWKETLGSGKSVSAASAITGADPRLIAGGLGVASSTFGYDLSNEKVAKRLTNQFLKATDFGAVEFEDLASMFGRVGVNADAANFSMSQTLALLESMSAIEQNPDRLGTLFDSGIRIFTNGEYRKRVSKTTGVNFFNDDGSARDPLKVLGDLSTRYKEYGTTEDRKARFSSVVFKGMDLDTQKFMRGVLSGNILSKAEGFDKILVGGADEIDKRLQDAIDNAVDSTGRLKGALRDAADSLVKPINESFSRLIQYGLDSKDKGGLGLSGSDLLMGGAGLVGAGALGYKYGGPLARKVLGKGGRLAGGVAAGKALEAMVGVTPVYVVNMPTMGGRNGSIIDDLIGAGGKGRARLPGLPGPGGYTGLPGEGMASKLSKLGWRSVFNDYASHYGGKALGWMGLNSTVLGGSVTSAGLGSASLGVGVAGAAGYGVGTLAYDHLLQGTDLADDIGRAIAKTLAFFGNDSAQSALDAEQKALAHLKVEVDDNRVTVRSVEATGMEVDAYGGSMVAP